MSRSHARFLLALCLSSTLVLGQSPAGGSAQNAGPAITISPDRPFTLEEAIAMGLNKNFGLQLQNLTIENQRETIEIQRAAIFDPTFSFSASRGTTQQVSSTNRLDGAAAPRSASTSYSATLAAPRIPWTNGTARLQSSLSRAASNSANDTFNPRYNSGVALNLTQPLFARFGQKLALQALDNARINFKIQTIQYRSAVLTTISSIESAYYNVVAQRETLKIRRIALDNNQRIFEENTVRRTTGMMTDLDVLNAQVGVSTSQNSVLQQEQAVRDAEESLLSLINAPSLDIRPGPVAFDDYRDGLPNYAQSYKLARDFYPQRLTQEEQINLAERNLYFARKALQPDFELGGQLSYDARTVNSGFIDVLEILPKEHGNRWNISLSYNVPLGQRADKARYRQNLNSLNSAKIQLEQVEANLQLSVRQAIRAIETNLLAVELRAKETELTAKQHEQQEARFKAGLATAFLVLQTQERLETARINELSAKLQLRRAVSALRQLEGTSLERFRVQLPQ